MKEGETSDQLRAMKTSTTYHSWWMNLIEPVQIQGWKSGFSDVPSDRQTRQMSTRATVTLIQLIQLVQITRQ